MATLGPAVTHKGLSSRTDARPDAALPRAEPAHLGFTPKHYDIPSSQDVREERSETNSVKRRVTEGITERFPLTNLGAACRPRQ